jgi:hypothetical protein
MSRRSMPLLVAANRHSRLDKLARASKNNDN